MVGIGKNLPEKGKGSAGSRVRRRLKGHSSEKTCDLQKDGWRKNKGDPPVSGGVALWFSAMRLRPPWGVGRGLRARAGTVFKLRLQELHHEVAVEHFAREEEIAEVELALAKRNLLFRDLFHEFALGLFNETEDAGAVGGNEVVPDGAHVLGELFDVVAHLAREGRVRVGDVVFGIPSWSRNAWLTSFMLEKAR